MARFEVFAMVVSDDIGMTEGAQDIEFGRELFSLLLGHLDVVDLFATEDLYQIY